MKKRIINPFLPLNTYIPDGEAHVFGDRVYLYGSHDKAGGERFCMLNYEVWSAPIDDLSDWSCKGVSYNKKQDPHSINGKEVDFYAPDCVQGNDGKYYLYYVAMGPNTKNFGPISVAVSDHPEGPFSYLGDVSYKDKTPVLKYLNNDPAVINDNGKIYLYYGWGLSRDFRSKIFSPILKFVQSCLFKRSVKEIKETKPSILSCAFVELEEDMITVKHEPFAMFDSKTTADKNSVLYKHAFYEAPSIRKFNDLYYFVYSSGESNELCYATSKYPNKEFEFKGVLISNSDLGYQGNKKRLAAAGTIHGSIEQINNQYYLFYHRCTHNTDYSRQACVEKIYMKNDGTFEQVEMTTQSIGMPMIARGKFEASICCNLYNKKTKNVRGTKYSKSQPNIRQEGQYQYISSITNKTIIGYKYFEFNGENTIIVKTRNAKGKLYIYISLKDEPIGKINIDSDKDWKESKGKVEFKEGLYPLYFTYIGKGKLDFLDFEIKKESE